MATILYRNFQDREFLPIFEAILGEQGSDLDLRQLANELKHKAILSKRYEHISMGPIRATQNVTRAAGNVASAAKRSLSNLAGYFVS
jgi:hypothetical protein